MGVLLTPARSVWAAYGSVPQMFGISHTDFLFLWLLSLYFKTSNFDLGIEMGHEVVRDLKQPLWVIR